MRVSTRRFAIAVPIVVALAPAVARAQDLAGEWVFSTQGGGEQTLSLRADGSFEWAGMRGTWKASAGKLTLNGDEPLLYDAKLSGNTLTLTGGDLAAGGCVFTRRGAKPAPAAPPAVKTEPPKTDPAAPAAPAAPELSRKPQEVPVGAKKFVPRFSGPTRTFKAATCEVTVPESWSFVPGEKDGVSFLQVNPGLAATDVLRQQIIFWVKPVKLAEIEVGLKERVEKHAVEADALFHSNGLSLARKKTEVLDAPNGLLARLDYDGTLSNQFVQGQRATGLIAVAQRKMYDVAVTIVTLEGNAKDSTDDALAVLDSAKCFLNKDRDVAFEQKILGPWILPSKTGNVWETYEFFANGTYKWHHESSYTGQFKDAGGTQTGYWGTANQNDESGRYEIRGDVLFFSSDRGEQGLHVNLGVDAKGRTALTIGSHTFVK
jgi:hypothetical protein